jgi:hypothetical protein
VCVCVGEGRQGPGHLSCRGWCGAQGEEAAERAEGGEIGVEVHEVQ